MNVVSLFAGCGGFDLGFLTQGYTVNRAFDVDRVACENYKENIGSHIVKADLTNGIPDLSAFNKPDVVIAGPPCQGFSTAGKRLFNDERNHLLTLTADLALSIEPKVLVVENVPGVLSKPHSFYWHKLDETMRLRGYQTHTITVDTSELGMAQKRKRVLFFAWKTQGFATFDIPEVPSNTIQETLSKIKGVANHRPKRLVDDSVEWKIAANIKQGQKLSNVRGGKNSVATWDIPDVYGKVTDHERTVLELLRRLRRQNRTRSTGDADPVCLSRLEAALGTQFHDLVESLIEKGFVKRVEGGVDLVGTFNGKYRRMVWRGHCLTVDTRFGSPRHFLHPIYNRGFTIREAARLQGFDDSYTFEGNSNSMYRLIGNAVPPPLGSLAAIFTKQLLGG